MITRVKVAPIEQHCPRIAVRPGIDRTVGIEVEIDTQTIVQCDTAFCLLDPEVRKGTVAWYMSDASRAEIAAAFRCNPDDVGPWICARSVEAD